MANPLDLQEQEQLEDIKAFWKRYGNLIAWLITACLLAYAGWNGWGWYQRDQTAKAGLVNRPETVVTRPSEPGSCRS